MARRLADAAGTPPRLTGRRETGLPRPSRSTSIGAGRRQATAPASGGPGHVPPYHDGRTGRVGPRRDQRLRRRAAAGHHKPVGVAGPYRLAGGRRPALVRRGPPAAPATSIGGRASPCPMGVIFSVPARWRAEAVTVGRDAAIGDAVPVCEVDAKPAGHLGFLRVWTADARLGQQDTMDRFLDAYDATERQYRRTEAGPLDAFEASFVGPGGTRERAILVSTIWGRFLLTVGGADDAEHQAMLPAYQLAKQTARNNRE
ncbi:lipoprotein [Micromonospora sp. MS34]|uniref:lipoprotein n=1 Tax=Micromonospora sp. MS34 TaxID=3385971 RepID=UPI0039A37CDA